MSLKAVFKDSLKPKDQLPKEMYNEGVDYAITFNPPPISHDDLYDFESITNKICEHIYDVRRLLLKLSGMATIILYVEFSRTGRLHYHGTFNIKDKQACNFKVFAIPILSAIGQVCIRPINDKVLSEEEDGKNYKSWHEYCTKESKQVEDAGYPTVIDNLPLMAKQLEDGNKRGKQLEVKRKHKKEMISN